MGLTATEVALRAADKSVSLADLTEEAFRGPIADAGFAVRDGQIAMARAVAESIGGDALAVEAATGCHAPGSEVLMCDGSVAKVEDVLVGQSLLGPDGTPRLVLALAGGIGEMWRVVPVKGDPFVVNRDHVLTLQHTVTHEMVDVTVDEWLTWGVTDRHVHKLVRTGVGDLGQHPEGIDPYVLGLLLGDGHLSAKGSITFNKPDVEVRPALEEMAAAFGIRIAWSGNTGRIAGLAGTIGRGRGRNPLHVALEDDGLLVLSDAKFVPCRYLRTTRTARLELLAGLIDTDGYMSGGGFDYISASKRLASDVAYLARSVGLAAYVKECRKGCQNGFIGTYYRVSISGDCSIVPCRILRKKAPARAQVKSVLRTGFRMELVGEGPFHGFQLDGDRRYLMADFTITHNSGKSLAYLVPGILAVFRARANGDPKRMVVSTSGIQLQAQVVRKDVPAIAAALGLGVSCAVLKGRSNYTCHDRIATERQVLVGTNLTAARQAASWLATGGTGDKDDAPTPEVLTRWRSLSVSSEDCLKDACKFADECIANKARKRAMAAGIVVVNHWYLALGSKALSDGNTVLLVIDEAHDLEDSLRGAGSMSLRASAARYWRQTMEAAGVTGPVTDSLADGIVQVVKESERLAAGRRQVRLGPDWALAVDEQAVAGQPLLADVPSMVEDAAEALRAAVPALPEDEKDRVRTKAKALESLADRVGRLTRPGATDCVWTDNDQNGHPELRVATVTPVLPGTWGAVVACSATLGGGDEPGNGMREVLGRSKVSSLTIRSPWPVQDMAIAIVPDGPEPSDPQWVPWVNARAVDLCRQVGGGALILATSTSRAKELAAHLRGALPFGVRCQGEAGRGELIDWFRRDTDGVLVGTRSLFQGVDVQGDALRAVLLDRVPFPSPGDPMEEAIADRLRLIGRDPFRSRAVAVAATMVRQAAGRLLRSATDRGVVMITDPRIRSARWGGAILRALDPIPVTRDPDDAGRLWRGEPVSHGPPVIVPRRVKR